MSALDLMALNNRLCVLMFQAQTVMALRLMGMSGALPQRRGENHRMMHEKGPAMIKAYAAATKAAMAGQSPDRILTAAMVPVSRKVRANRKRLMK